MIYLPAPWNESQSLVDISTQRSGLRIVLLTADSTRILCAMADHGCAPKLIVTPRSFSRFTTPALHQRLLERLGSFFAPDTPLQSVAKELQIPLLQPYSIHDKIFLASLANRKPDLLVVAGYPEIFPKELLSIPRYGSINIHASILPKYRGPQPIAQALLHGEAYTGVSLHWMEEQIDAGALLAQDIVPIFEKDTVQSLSSRIFELGGRILIDVLERIALGKIPKIAQDPLRASYFSRLPARAGRLDWTWSAHAIYHWIRLAPWLDVHTFLQGWKISVLGCRRLPEILLEDGQIQTEQPGQIVARTKEGLAVVCGDGQRLMVTDFKIREGWPKRRKANLKLQSGARLDPDHRAMFPMPRKTKRTSFRR